MAVDETAHEEPVTLDDELVALLATAELSKRELRCIECGYGAVSAGPLRCPMCGGDAWDFVEWRPFRRRERSSR